MATQAEQLILRGLHLIVRTSFTPSDPIAQGKHLVALQNDIGPWLKDYAEEIAKPASDDPAFISRATGPGDGNGGLQQ